MDRKRRPVAEEARGKGGNGDFKKVQVDRWLQLSSSLKLWYFQNKSNLTVIGGRSQRHRINRGDRLPLVKIVEGEEEWLIVIHVPSLENGIVVRNQQCEPE